MIARRRFFCNVAATSLGFTLQRLLTRRGLYCKLYRLQYKHQETSHVASVPTAAPAF
jgi:hypothetical protein